MAKSENNMFELRVLFSDLTMKIFSDFAIACLVFSDICTLPCKNFQSYHASDSPILPLFLVKFSDCIILLPLAKM